MAEFQHTSSEWPEGAKLLYSNHTEREDQPEEGRTRPIRTSIFSALRVLAIATGGFLLGFICKKDDCPRPYSGLSAFADIDTSTFPSVATIPIYRSNTSIWQRPPSAEVDAAWHAIAKTPVFLLPEDDMRSLGKNPEDYTAVPPELGYGEKKYVTKFAHTHNIHCLNQIRRRVYSHLYTMSNITMDWIHIDHCFHSLVEHLMCHVEYDVINFIWVEGEPWPQNHVNISRQCRSLESLMQFAEDHRVDRDKRFLYMQPSARDKVFPQDAGLRKLEQGMARANPQLPTLEEEIAQNVQRYNDAMAEWRKTGTIPIDETRE